MVILDGAEPTVLELEILEIDRRRLDSEPDDPVDDVPGIGVVHVVAEQQLQVVVDVAFAVLGEAETKALKEQINRWDICFKNWHSLHRRVQNISSHTNFLIHC